jgi:NAD(P)-dependent dehydrogenase (short-subunit alcohol dehydrogenase family)
VEAEPSCDILVNNVGIYGPQDFFDIPDSEWTRFFELNVMSGVRLSRAYMPAMLRRNWGRVVFLSSEAGLNIPPEMIHYGFEARSCQRRSGDHAHRPRRRCANRDHEALCGEIATLPVNDRLALPSTRSSKVSASLAGFSTGMTSRLV